MENPDTWTALERCIQAAIEAHQTDADMAYWITDAVEDEGLFKDSEDEHDYIDTMTDLIQLVINKYNKFYSDNNDVCYPIIRCND